MSEASAVCVGHTLLPTILIVGDITIKAGTVFGPRQLHEYELIYYPNGSKTIYKVEDQQIVLAEPCFLICRPHVPHLYECNSAHPLRHMFIRFTFDSTHIASCINDIGPLKNGAPSYFPIKNELLTGMMKQILYTAYYQPDRLQVRGGTLLLALLQQLDGLTDEFADDFNRQIPVQISNAIKYIEKNLHTHLSIESVAQHVCWTHEHFSRKFIQYMGRTPRQAITERRVERACQLLMKKDWNAKQIAHAVGFSDVNYFYKVFKAVKGITAIKFREKYYDPRFDVLDAGDSLMPYPPNSILYDQSSYASEA